MALVGALVVAISALVLAPGYLFYFDLTPKVIVLLAGTALALVAAAISGLSLPVRSRRMAAFSLLIVFYVASLAAATAASSNRGLSLFGSNWRRFGSVTETTVCLFAWLIALGCAGAPKRVTTVLRGFAVAGAISAAYGILQYFGWDPFLPAARYHFGEGVATVVRPPGTLGHGNYFAAWLSIVAFLSLALRAMETSAVARRLCVAGALLASCAMLLTGTRAAVVGMLAGGLVWLMIERARLGRRILLFAAIAASACVAFGLAPPGRQLRARVRSVAQDPWGGGRIILWRDSLRMARRHLIAGYGPEVFASQFPHFESSEFAIENPGIQPSTNNMFLDALVAQGLPGMLLLAALCAGGLVTAVRLRRPAFAAALVAGIVSQQFSPLTPSNALILWVTLGLLAALDAPPPGEPRQRFARLIGAAVTAAILLSVATRLAIADRALALTKQQLDAGDLPRAEAQYRRYQRARLPGDNAGDWYSQAALAAALRIRAEHAAGAATQKPEPHPRTVCHPGRTDCPSGSAPPSEIKAHST